MENLITFIYIILGIYAIYYGVVKKGKIYNNPKISKEYKQKFDKWLSIFLLTCGTLLIAGSTLELFQVHSYIYGAIYVITMIEFCVFCWYLLRLYRKSERK